VQKARNEKLREKEKVSDTKHLPRGKKLVLPSKT
jgi:hypothetical protein